MKRVALVGADIHDGTELWSSHALVLEGDIIVGIVPAGDIGDARKVPVKGGTILPGFVDLQVNGGGGVMFNDDPSVDTLRVISEAHARLGTRAFLPTLITDTRPRMLAAIEAVKQAIAQEVPGILGLHLEGPHLSVARRGAHDAALIRAMTEADLALLLDAATQIVNLMVTLAPESVTHAQIGALHAAGVIVSLGHTDADFETCRTAMEAGAGCVTHLFNAMSQFRNREPGLVGMALTSPASSASLIADGIHVHPSSIQLALAAKRGPGQLFLITDSTAAAGSEIAGFELNGRQIKRENGRLTLADGTLAGADLDFTRALQVMVNQVGVDLRQAIAMATSIPAKLLNNAHGCGQLKAGERSQAIHLGVSELEHPNEFGTPTALRDLLS